MEHIKAVNELHDFVLSSGIWERLEMNAGDKLLISVDNKVIATRRFEMDSGLGCYACHCAQELIIHSKYIDALKDLKNTGKE